MCSSSWNAYCKRVKEPLDVQNGFVAITVVGLHVLTLKLHTNGLSISSNSLLSCMIFETALIFMHFALFIYFNAYSVCQIAKTFLAN